MKKNISINISGIIFHIEEDGYDALRKYLDSINQYFGSFEDSSEILADIESRIAEIFLSKLNEGKQVINAEDVQSLITIMGSVNDFRAAEQQEAAAAENPKQQQKSTADDQSSSSRSSQPSKKLLRDQNKKILGGVCSGLGHYFNIDPVWPRLLFALLMLGTSGIFFLIYIILWIALPGSTELEDESTTRKMYRNPDAKVVGGVASGVAAYFGADITLIRVLFVITTIFFGTGIVVYIVLWIALPEAKTITDKMKMQGEPVTLSNIESSVKKNLNEKDTEEESTLAKIILFPFRVLAAVLNAIGRFLGPAFLVLGEIIRIGVGIFISLLGFFMGISLIFSFGLILGIFSLSALPNWWDGKFNMMTLPFENIRQAFPTWTTVFAFLAAFIPAMFIMLLGNSILAKRIVFKAVYGWTLVVLFFVSILFLSLSIPQLIYTFKEQGEHKVEKVFTIQSGTPTLKVRQTGLDDYEATDLLLHGYEGNSVKLIERFGAQGATKLNARENAQAVTYEVMQADSVLTFDSNITFQKDAKFRFQRLDMDLYIPYNVNFKIDEDMWDLIDNFWRHDFQDHENNQTYKMTSDNKLVCTTCPAPPADTNGLSAHDQFGLKDFKEVELTGVFDVIIQRSDEFSIQMEGNAEQKKLYDVQERGGTLEIEFKHRRKNFWKDDNSKENLVDFIINMPSLEKLKVTGAGKIKVRGFDEEDVQMQFTGALVGDIQLNANDLAIETTGPVVLELEGRGDYLEATLTGPSEFKASNYPVNRAVVSAHGLGQARVNVSGTLEIEKDFTSTVRYTGNPEMVKKE